MQKTKAERVQEFIRRLDAAQSAASEQEAFELIETTLNGVENEFTTIPFSPSDYRTDGRLYPPQGDNKTTIRPGLVSYRSVGHRTYIAANGAIRIEKLDGTCDIDKPGSDGQRISL